MATGFLSFLAPDAVAVIGASNEPTKRGYRAVQTLLKDRFAGRIYPIHPRATEVQGLRAYPDLASVPEPIDLALVCYMALCRVLPLPLHDYLENVVGRFTPEKRRLVIYDQLNPTHVHYHSREEAERLLTASGFVDVRLHHRRRYSWSVVGRKPESRRR